MTLSKSKVPYNCIIVPDVHEEIDRVESILTAGIGYQFIFLGDWFDSWSGVTANTEKTIDWLAKNLLNPSYTFCWGNHDLSYYQPEFYKCSGYNEERANIIKKKLTQEHWNTFIPGVIIENTLNTYLVSHAGINPAFIKYDPRKSEKEAIHNLLLRAAKNAKARVRDPLFEVGAGRGGGEYAIGGITWQDWHSELEDLRDVFQIVGHTSGYYPKLKGKSLNIDTGLKDIARLGEKDLSIINLESLGIK